MVLDRQPLSARLGHGKVTFSSVRCVQCRRPTRADADGAEWHTYRARGGAGPPGRLSTHVLPPGPLPLPCPLGDSGRRLGSALASPVSYL